MTLALGECLFFSLYFLILTNVKVLSYIVYNLQNTQLGDDDQQPQPLPQLTTVNIDD